MKRMIRSFFIAGALVLGLTGHCPAGITEPEVLAAIADKGVRPALVRSADAAAGLHRAVEDLCRQPDSTRLNGARAAWTAAYLAWCRAMPFMLGSSAVLERQVGKWPANGVVLDAAVTREDLAHMLKNPDARGFAGAEHLLFAPQTAAAATADGRCAHLLDVTDELARLTDKARAGWEADKGERFKKAGDGNPFLLPEDALSLVLARVLNVTEKLLRDRIGSPSNFFESPSRPDNLEAWQSHASARAIRATVSGIAMAVTGDAGLTRLVATKDGLYESSDPKLAKKIEKKLKRIDKILVKLEGKDLHRRVKAKPSTLEDLYEELQELQEQMVEAALVLELDVRSGLEVQLTE